MRALLSRQVSSPLRLFLVLALCFLGYSLIAVGLLGSQTFLHDEWRILTLAHHEPFPAVLKSAMYDAKRPLQSVGWILTYKAVGFQDLVFNGVSALERLASVLLAVVAVGVAWPHKTRFTMLVAVLLFFLPPFTIFFYDFSADGVWQGLLLFWCAVLLWQAAAVFVRIRWLAAVIAGLMWGISLLNYEIALLLPPVGGILAAVVFARQQPSRRQWISAGVLWSLSLVIGYGLYWIVRERYDLNVHSSFAGLPTLQLGLTSLGTMLRLAGPPPTLQMAQPLDVLIAVAMGVVVWLVLGQTKTPGDSLETSQQSWPWIVGGLGMVAFVTGLAPYLITGYSPMIGYDRTARIYGAAIFGCVLIVAVLLVKSVRAWAFVRVGVALWVVMMALYPLTSRYDLQKAGQLRQQFMLDLIAQAPRLQPDTLVVWVDANGMVGDAPITGWGLRFMNIFYDPSIAWISVPPGPLIVSKTGINSAEKPPLPITHVIIFRREGEHLRLIDCLKEGDTPNIQWKDGITELCTNRERILPDPEQDNLHRLQALNLLPLTPPFGPLP